MGGPGSGRKKGSKNKPKLEIREEDREVDKDMEQETPTRKGKGGKKNKESVKARDAAGEAGQSTSADNPDANNSEPWTFETLPELNADEEMDLDVFGWVEYTPPKPKRGLHGTMDGAMDEDENEKSENDRLSLMGPYKRNPHPARRRTQAEQDALDAETSDDDEETVVKDSAADKTPAAPAKRGMAKQTPKSRANSPKGRAKKIHKTSTAIERNALNRKLLLGIYRTPGRKVVLLTGGIYKPAGKVANADMKRWMAAVAEAIRRTRTAHPQEDWYFAMVDLAQRVIGIKGWSGRPPREVQASDATMESYNRYLGTLVDAGRLPEGTYDTLGAPDASEPNLAVPAWVIPQVEQTLQRPDWTELLEHLDGETTGGGRQRHSVLHPALPDDDHRRQTVADIPQVYDAIRTAKDHYSRHLALPSYFNTRGEVYASSHFTGPLRESLHQPLIDYHQQLADANSPLKLPEGIFKSAFANAEGRFRGLLAPNSLNSRGDARRRQRQSTEAQHNSKGQFIKGTREITQATKRELINAKLLGDDLEAAGKEKGRTDKGRNAMDSLSIDLAKREMKQDKADHVLVEVYKKLEAEKRKYKKDLLLAESRIDHLQKTIKSLRAQGPAVQFAEVLDRNTQLETQIQSMHAAAESALHRRELQLADRHARELEARSYEIVEYKTMAEKLKTAMDDIRKRVNRGLPPFPSQADGLTPTPDTETTDDIAAGNGESQLIRSASVEASREGDVDFSLFIKESDSYNECSNAVPEERAFVDTDDEEEFLKALEESSDK